MDEFQLADWQFGLLSGFGFALMYTMAGIPLARLAERYNRVKIIAASIIIWSLMTALCGLANGFVALLIFRIGVGIGEAGCTPPANSIIADYYPPRSRARALATYAMGVTLGSLLANLFGGPIAEAFSWREAFLILGIPGVFVGLIVYFTVKEPPRGYSDLPGTPQLGARGFGETLRLLGAKPTFWLNMIAATLVAFVGYGLSNFQAPFFQRVHGMSVGDVATQVSVPLGIAAASGTLFAGVLAEKISGKYPTSVAWIAGLGLLISTPFYWLGFLANTVGEATLLIGIGAFLHYGYLGAQYTVCQSVVDARSRATAIASTLFIVNLLGYGLGPLTIGYLSDVFANTNLADTGFALSQCKGSEADLIQSIGSANLALCKTATAEGLRTAIKAISTIFFLGGLVYLWTSRTMHKDMISAG